VSCLLSWRLDAQCADELFALAGQLVVHFANVFISDLVAHHTVQNPCVLYFLNIVVDTTVGVSFRLTSKPAERAASRPWLTCRSTLFVAEQVSG
jgi:hypothetical protein